jgi:hypothetical protein
MKNRIKDHHNYIVVLRIHGLLFRRHSRRHGIHCKLSLDHHEEGRHREGESAGFSAASSERAPEEPVDKRE